MRASTVARLALAMACTLTLGVAGSSSAQEQRATVTSSAPYALMPVEPYAGYQPQTKCRQTPKPGVLLLADWLVSRGGGYGPISRPCTDAGMSEHKESRAFDWILDARSDTDQALATALLDELLAPDDLGEPHAEARRMGIMYVIWNDTMYAAYDDFVPKRYLSSSCRTRRTCSPTLRHRDHMHISLTRKGARGTTSWYVVQPQVSSQPSTSLAGRVPGPA